MDNTSVKFVSMNVRGMRDKRKRQKLFKWIAIHKYDIICIQESHSSPDIEVLWKTEFGGDIVFAHGQTNACGVMILFKSDLVKQIHDVMLNNNGRFIVMDITVREKRLTLTNLYGPNSDDKDFFATIYGKIENYSNDNRLIMGDFNHILNPILDKQGGRPDHANVKAREVTLNYLEEFEMVDIFRKLNPNVKQFSYHTARPNVVFTRIDNILLSSGLVSLCEKCDIIPCYVSDHSFVTINLICSELNRGRGFWKMNCCYLHDQDYITQIQEVISNTVRDNPGADAHLLWDTIKMSIRGKSIQYSSRKKRSKENLLSALEKRLNNLQIMFAQTEQKDIFDEIQTLKYDIDQIITEKTKGSILRCKLKWHEDGEKIK